jgi:hypothetical protein
MGRIAESLRANLRELAQTDARMLRELDGVLPSTAQPELQVAGELSEGLDRLGLKELKALCKERGFKGYTGLTKAALIQRLRGGEAPVAAKAQAKAVAIPSGLAAIEARLDRMEALLQRIAERVGVSDALIDGSCGGR